MRLAQALRPKQPKNFKITALAAVGFVGLWIVGAWLWPWSPKRGLGLAFGIFAAFAFVFEMLYPSRRPRAWPFGTAKAWIQAHVYLGALAMLAVVIHAGGWPRGGFGWWLMLLSLWTTLSGLVGVWLQKTQPLALAEGLRVEALFERIPGLAVLRPSWSYVFDVRSGRERALDPFRQISAYVRADEKGKVEDLMSLYTEKIELDAQWSVQRVLRTWLWIHVPPAAVLMGLLVIHVFAWLWY